MEVELNRDGHLALAGCDLLHPVVMWVVHYAANRLVAEAVDGGVVIRPGMATGFDDHWPEVLAGGPRLLPARHDDTAG
jgi:hypothetical protein